MNNIAATTTMFKEDQFIQLLDSILSADNNPFFLQEELSDLAHSPATKKAAFLIAFIPYVWEYENSMEAPTSSDWEYVEGHYPTFYKMSKDAQIQYLQEMV